MPTYGRPAYVNEAVQMFLDQDYAPERRELIILNDCPGQVYRTNIPDKYNVRIFNAAHRYKSLGDKRNTCIEYARGDLIAVWDDDDVHLPWRLSFSCGEMQKHQLPFYRAAHLWAYWGTRQLNENRCSPGYDCQNNTLFAKSLWQDVGGYPPFTIGEDAHFIHKVHCHLSSDFIARPIDQEDRFLILRGKSHFPHVSQGGGTGTLELRPGEFMVRPQPINDPILKACVSELTTRRSPSIQCKRNATLITNKAGRPILSVCVSLKNRSIVQYEGDLFPLFPNCVEALDEASTSFGGEIELVIADFESNDAPPNEWIHDNTNRLRIQIVNLRGPFSRGRGFNEAVRNAHSDRILLLDADMLIDAMGLRRANDLIKRNAIWFPSYRCLNRDGTDDKWNDFRLTTLAIGRDVYEAAGGMPEFRSWGGDGELLYDRVRRYGVVVRERWPGLRHQWHPESLRHLFDHHEQRTDCGEYGEQQRRSSTQRSPTECAAGIRPKPQRMPILQHLDHTSTAHRPCLSCDNHFALSHGLLGCRLNGRKPVPWNQVRCGLNKWTPELSRRKVSIS